VNRAVQDAEKELHDAKSSSQLATAERRLEEAVRRQRSLLEPPKVVPVTGAAFRAGMVKEKELNGLIMKGENLRNAEFNYRALRGSDFSNSDLSEATFQGSDLRATTFQGAVLHETSFYLADLRGANLRDAKLSRAGFRQARLEGADLSGATLEDCDLRAAFDATTKWPDGFSPSEAGAVYTDDPALSTRTQLDDA
jgi:uncharacterized protein YjbI with pentapeptide repeats